jgi:proline iminopeptidase
MRNPTAYLGAVIVESPVAGRRSQEVIISTARVNGIDLFYVSVGTGLPCLVMHGGLGLDHTTLHPWLDPLGDTIQLVYYDHRGNGRSGRSPLASMTLEQLAADADALRADLRFEKVAVLGHSAGGCIALTLALRCPERISHLILMNTAPVFDYEEDIVANAQREGATEDMLAALQAPNPSEDGEFRRMFELITPLYFHQFDPQLAQQVTANAIFSGLAAASTDVFLSTYNVVPQLAHIQAPTSFLLAAMTSSVRPHRPKGCTNASPTQSL